MLANAAQCGDFLDRCHLGLMMIGIAVPGMPHRDLGAWISERSCGWLSTTSTLARFTILRLYFLEEVIDVFAFA